jgi:hypothetical protein
MWLPPGKRSILTDDQVRRASAIAAERGYARQLAPRLLEQLRPSVYSVMVAQLNADEDVAR